MIHPRPSSDIPGQDQQAWGVVLAVLAVAVACCAGYLFGVKLSPLTHDRNFPWIVARSTGVAAVVALGASCVSGLVFRRPAGSRRRLHPETTVRAHVALAAAVAALVTAHIGSLLADRWSGVTWSSVVVPGTAQYRPTAVAYGTVAVALVALATSSAALAGRWLVGARWLRVHATALPAFALAWLHGVTAGSDTGPLRVMYILLGAAVLLSVLVRFSSRGRTRARPALEAPEAAR